MKKFLLIFALGFFVISCKSILSKDKDVLQDINFRVGDCKISFESRTYLTEQSSSAGFIHSEAIHLGDLVGAGNLFQFIIFSSYFDMDNLPQFLESNGIDNIISNDSTLRGNVRGVFSFAKFKYIQSNKILVIGYSDKENDSNMEREVENLVESSNGDNC